MRSYLGRFARVTRGCVTDPVLRLACAGGRSLHDPIPARPSGSVAKGLRCLRKGPHVTQPRSARLLLPRCAARARPPVLHSRRRHLLGRYLQSPWSQTSAPCSRAPRQLRALRQLANRLCARRSAPAISALAGFVPGSLQRHHRARRPWKHVSSAASSRRTATAAASAWRAACALPQPLPTYPTRTGPRQLCCRPPLLSVTAAGHAPASPAFKRNAWLHYTRV